MRFLMLRLGLGLPITMYIFKVMDKFFISVCHQKNYKLWHKRIFMRKNHSTVIDHSYFFPSLVSFLITNTENSPCSSFTFVKSSVKNTLSIPSSFCIHLYINYQELQLQIIVAWLHRFFFQDINLQISKLSCSP